jgi:hypothetical protein
MQRKNWGLVVKWACAIARLGHPECVLFLHIAKCSVLSLSFLVANKELNKFNLINQMKILVEAINRGKPK